MSGRKPGHNNHRYDDYCCGYRCVKTISLFSFFGGEYFCKHFTHLLFVCWRFSLRFDDDGMYPFLSTQKTTITTTPSSSSGRKRSVVIYHPRKALAPPHTHTQDHASRLTNHTEIFVFSGYILGAPAHWDVETNVDWTISALVFNVFSAAGQLAFSLDYCTRRDDTTNEIKIHTSACDPIDVRLPTTGVYWATCWARAVE